MFVSNLFHAVIKILSSTDKNIFDLDSVGWFQICGLNRHVGPVEHVRLFHYVYRSPLVAIFRRSNRN